VTRPDPTHRHLVLIGLMGTGKTTVGRLLAERLRRRFVDTDAEIERRSGRTVRDIFVADGEPEFRRIEAEVLDDSIAAEEPCVIAAAGGVVLSQANRDALRTGRCRVVWLVAEPEALVGRVRQGQHRPAIEADPAGTLKLMAAEREALYRESADAIVRVDGRTIQDVVDAVLR